MAILTEEYYTLYHEKATKARKVHNCAACNESISKDHIYYKIFVLYDGHGKTIKRCLRCQKIHVYLRQMDNEFWPDEKLNCGHEFEEFWGCSPPEEIASLAFITQKEAQEKYGKNY